MAATKRAADQREIRDKAERAMTGGLGAVRDAKKADPEFLASRPLNAPEGTFPPTNIDWSKLTVQGQPIPAHLYDLVPYAATDQGIAERAQKLGDARVAAGLPREFEPSGVSFGADPVDKSVRKYGDGLRDSVDQWANPDPLRESMDRHLAPGERGRFLSPKKCDVAGLRGWVPKKDEAGKLVTVGEMILGTMPEHVAKSRDKFFKNKADSMMVRASESEQDANDRATDLTLGRRRAGSALDKGFETFRGDPANMEDADFALPGLDTDRA